MKKCLLFVIYGSGYGFLSPACFLPQSQTDTASLGLAGEDPGLYAVLDLFLKSKTIEALKNR